MYWSAKFEFSDSRRVRRNADGVITHGATEPVLSILDVRGFPVEDLFLIGFNDNCGSILVETESRAENVAAALEPAYRVKIHQDERGNWNAVYDRRDMDGSVGSHFITDLVLEDGRHVIRNGRWVK